MQAPRVLGVDPGTQIVGWSVAERGDDGRALRLASGVWRLGRAPRTPADRLRRLHVRCSEVLQLWSPGLVALESAYFGRNARSAMRLGEARGVVLALAAVHEVPVLELAPATVKRRVGGSGQAGKDALAAALRLHCDLADHDFAAEDESDALAVAVCALLLEDLPPEGGSAAPGGPGRSRLPPGARFQ